MERPVPSGGRATVLTVVAVLVVLSSAAEPADRPLPGFNVTFERELPSPIKWAFDVRWLDDDTVAVAAGRDGVFELSTSHPAAPSRRVAGSERLTYAGRLAASDDLLATAFPIGSVAWRQRGDGGAWKRDAPMAAIVDFDVAGRRTLLLGARRVEMPGATRAVWAPEGGILFRGDLDGDPSPLTRVMTAGSGVDGKAMEMARCDVLELGAVRFLSGGRYAVIPGVQPGVFVYGADGGLSRAWSSSALGIYDDCDLDEKQMERVSADMDARIAWWQRHTVLDDLVPWGEGWFAALVRTPRDDGATWSFHPFAADGPQPSVNLPLEGGSRGLHVRADSRGDRLAVLLFDYQQGDSLDRPKHRPRLLVLETGKERVEK